MSSDVSPAVAAVRDAMERLVAPLSTRGPRVRLALLFGSTARGTAGPGSDIDLAVDAGPGVDLAQLSAELSTALGREVDVVALADAGVPLLERLVHEGVVVYEGVPHAAARWRSHVLSDLEVDRPWHARMRNAWLARVASGGLGDGRS